MVEEEMANEAYINVDGRNDHVGLNFHVDNRLEPFLRRRLQTTEKWHWYNRPIRTCPRVVVQRNSETVKMFMVSDRFR